ncbi:MAG: outer membrane lipoprotein chaperone LolA [Proteobacteria bacterium]|nr:outer membrane lipoprotein chaperone LolA [Pseudomonadota bacterium]
MKLLNIFLMLLFTASSVAENKTEDHLARFLDNMQTLQANFKQILVDDQGTELESSSGVVFLKRPNKFRWDYKHPYQQTIVTNGEVLWFYDEDLEQVIIREASSSVEGTPVAILGSYEDIDKQFIIIDMENIEGFDWVELTPRDIESQYNSIRLGFDKEKLGMMVMFDNLGQVTRIDFTEEVINKKLDNSTFDFEPPQGVDVIDDRG